MKKYFILLIAICSVVLVQAQDQAAVMRIVSYNLRQDTPSDSMNAWQYRKDKVNDLIRYHKFDIIGTQEGFHHQLQDILRLPGYAYTGSGRDDGKQAGEHSAIIYKTERFEVLQAGDFWLSETPDVPGKGWDATCCNRICSWAKFRDKTTGKTFYFFNVHFDHRGVVARIESGKLMKKKIEEIAGNNAVIATGDFNSTPETEQIQLLSQFMNDAYKITIEPVYGPQGTTNRRFKNPLSPNRIDYIFLSNHFQVNTYAHLTDNDGMHYPSDHIPVMADIVLK